jgi:hypothetical protein
LSSMMLRVREYLSVRRREGCSTTLVGSLLGELQRL